MRKNGATPDDSVRKKLYAAVACPDSPPIMQGFIRPVARVGSGDPVRVLRLYTTNTPDEVCSIYC